MAGRSGGKLARLFGRRDAEGHDLFGECLHPFQDGSQSPNSVFQACIEAPVADGAFYYRGSNGAAFAWYPRGEVEHGDRLALDALDRQAVQIRDGNNQLTKDGAHNSVSLPREAFKLHVQVAACADFVSQLLNQGEQHGLVGKDLDGAARSVERVLVDSGAENKEGGGRLQQGLAGVVYFDADGRHALSALASLAEEAAVDPILFFGAHRLLFAHFSWVA